MTGMMEFFARYGWHLAALLTGAVITITVWMFKHPEDFFLIEVDEDEQRVEIEEIDHAK